MSPVLVITNNVDAQGQQEVTVRLRGMELYRGKNPSAAMRRDLLMTARPWFDAGDGNEDMFNAAMDALDKPIDHVEDEDA